MSGSADNSMRLWDCEQGTTISRLDTSTAVRTCGFSYCGNLIMFSTDRQMGHNCHIMMVDIRQGKYSKQEYMFEF